MRILAHIFPDSMNPRRCLGLLACTLLFSACAEVDYNNANNYPNFKNRHKIAVVARLGDVIGGGRIAHLKV